MELEAFTENQILKNFFTNPSLSRRETQQVEFLEQFGIKEVTLVTGRVHVVGDYVCQIFQVKAPNSKNTTAHMLNIDLLRNLI